MLDHNTYGHIEAHYDHAREKHPYFADALLPCDLKEDAPFYTDRKSVEWQIAKNVVSSKTRLRRLAKSGSVTFMNVLDAEIWEILEALREGDKAHAIDECYDAIAVLLRVIDVLTGTQKLGKPDAAVQP